LCINYFFYIYWAALRAHIRTKRKNKEKNFN